jgi:hypothetical protein
MKYLKSYKLFESNYEDTPSEIITQKIQKTIRDICLELNDEGFTTSYQWWPP